MLVYKRTNGKRSVDMQENKQWVAECVSEYELKAVGRMAVHTHTDTLRNQITDKAQTHQHTRSNAGIKYNGILT